MAVFVLYCPKHNRIKRSNGWQPLGNEIEHARLKTLKCDRCAKEEKNVEWKRQEISC